MKVLITGGAGYIGSTIAACCTDNGITPVILDDYSKGLREFARPYANYEGDIADTALIRRILSEHQAGDRDHQQQQRRHGEHRVIGQCRTHAGCIVVDPGRAGALEQAEPLR